MRLLNSTVAGTPSSEEGGRRADRDCVQILIKGKSNKLETDLEKSGIDLATTLPPSGYTFLEYETSDISVQLLAFHESGT
ncbi:hypothetical protein P879_03216 [Paragonimus westermani]|uniref:Uncharacterized protein n=1 Tax=Paragonimus westermani TaxID=34504 RepID=A0A8T0DLH2_9TREM|nr:hypothetical protein P879_03216 [Paragonimus westermani]